MVSKVEIEKAKQIANVLKAKDDELFELEQAIVAVNNEVRQCVLDYLPDRIVKILGKSKKQRICLMEIDGDVNDIETLFVDSKGNVHYTSFEGGWRDINEADTTQLRRAFQKINDGKYKLQSTEGMLFVGWFD